MCKKKVRQIKRERWKHNIEDIRAATGTESHKDIMQTYLKKST